MMINIGRNMNCSVQKLLNKIQNMHFCVCKKHLSKFKKDDLHVRRLISDICWIINDVQQDATK
jgi:hypothetical protein